MAMTMRVRTKCIRCYRACHAPGLVQASGYALGMCGCALGAINVKECLKLILLPPRRAFGFCNRINHTFIDATPDNSSGIAITASVILAASFILASFYLVLSLWHACNSVCCICPNARANGERCRFHLDLLIPLGTYGMAVIMLSVVADLIVKHTPFSVTDTVRVIPDVLLLLGSFIQFLLHATFFFAYVVPLIWRVIRCKLAEVNPQVLPAPTWFPSIIGISCIVYAAQRFYPVDGSTPSIPWGVNSELVLVALRAILYVSLGNVVWSVPVILARSWRGKYTKVDNDSGVTTPLLKSNSTEDDSAVVRAQGPSLLFDEPSIAILAAPLALVAAAALTPTLQNDAATEFADNATADADWDGDAEYVFRVEQYAMLPVPGVYLLVSLALVGTAYTWVEVARRWKGLSRIWREGLPKAHKWGSITFPLTISSAVPLLLFQRIFPVGFMCGDTAAIPADAWWFSLLVVVGVCGFILYVVALVLIIVVNARFLAQITTSRVGSVYYSQHNL